MTTNYYGIWGNRRGDIQVVSGDLQHTSWLIVGMESFERGPWYMEEAFGLEENEGEYPDHGILLKDGSKRYLVPLSFWL